MRSQRHQADSKGSVSFINNFRFWRFFSFRIIEKNLNIFFSQYLSSVSCVQNQLKWLVYKSCEICSVWQTALGRQILVNDIAEKSIIFDCHLSIPDKIEILVFRSTEEMFTITLAGIDCKFFLNYPQFTINKFSTLSNSRPKKFQKIIDAGFVQNCLRKKGQLIFIR